MGERNKNPKSEIRRTKSETNSKDQKGNDQNAEGPLPFWICFFVLWICFGFRASDFGFPLCGLPSGFLSYGCFGRGLRLGRRIRRWHRIDGLRLRGLRLDRLRLDGGFDRRRLRPREQRASDADAAGEGAF